MEIPWTSIFSLQAQIGIFTLLTLLYIVTTVVYRLYLSPLTKFPGPKLAAATLWYEAYYNIVKNGQYTFKIKELHEKYGPIIRISPYELHINDPEYYDVLYSSRAPRNKYKFYTDQFGIPGATFSTIDHRHHRLRRQPANPFFSKQSILRLEPVLTDMLEKLCVRLDEYKKSGLPAPIRLIYQCLTTDVISLYAMNKNWNFLDSPDFSPRWFKTIKATGDMGQLFKQFPWMLTFSKSLPNWLVSALSPDLGLILNWKKSNEQHIQSIIEKRKKSEKKVGETDDEHALHRTIFHTLLDSKLPDEDKTVHRLAEEAQVIIGAGTDTTANALAQTTFHVLSNHRVLLKLKTELQTAIPDKYTRLSLTEIEKLPYLAAIIQEGLRLGYGLSTRLARIAPEEDLECNGYIIPRGTPVGMSSVLLHHNETNFPDSYKFIPERWLGEEGHVLDKYMVSFTRGSRQCIGMSLARAELCLTLATVFRRYNMELYDTDRERDIDLAYDGFLPQPSHQSKGVRVILS